MAITVDYSTTPFTIEIPKSDLTLASGSKYNLDVDTFWQLLRDYSDSEESMPFPIIYPRIPATASTPSITEINDDYYQLQFEDGLYSVNIINGNTNIRDVEVKNQVSVNTNNTTGFIDPTYLQFGTFDGYVWIDPSTSNTGTTYPVGTPAAPVNNDSDAQLIADAQGLYNLFARGNTTVTGVHSGIKFWGRSPRTTQITIDPSANISGCEFQSCLLSGDLGSNGSSYMITVALKNVTGIFGHLENCVLREGTNTLSSPNGFAMINKCSAVSAINPGTDIPIFDLAGSGRVASRSLDGEIIFQNKSSGNDCSLDLDGAVVTLDSTITAGTWRFSGIGKVIDNSGGTAVVDTTDLVSPQSVATAVGERTVESTYTADQVMKIMAAALAGKVSGAGSGVETFVGLDDATDRIVSTVDNDGNRTAVTVNGS